MIEMESYRRRQGMVRAARLLPDAQLPPELQAISDFTQTGLNVRLDTGVLEVAFGDYLLTDELGAYCTYTFDEFHNRFVPLTPTGGETRNV